jgi:hypothetical protein
MSCKCPKKYSPLIDRDIFAGKKAQGDKTYKAIREAAEF